MRLRNTVKKTFLVRFKQLKRLVLHLILCNFMLYLRYIVHQKHTFAFFLASLMLPAEDCLPLFFTFLCIHKQNVLNRKNSSLSIFDGFTCSDVLNMIWLCLWEMSVSVFVYDTNFVVSLSQELTRRNPWNFIFNGILTQIGAD